MNNGFKGYALVLSFHLVKLDNINKNIQNELKVYAFSNLLVVLLVLLPFFAVVAVRLAVLSFLLAFVVVARLLGCPIRNKF